MASDQRLDFYSTVHRRIRALCDEVERLRAERQELLDKLSDCESNMVNATEWLDQKERAERAEAELEEARELLQRWSDSTDEGPEGTTLAFLSQPKAGGGEGDK